MIITNHRLFPTLHGQDGQAQLTLYTKQHLVQRSKITVADFPWFEMETTVFFLFYYFLQTKSNNKLCTPTLSLRTKPILDLRFCLSVTFVVLLQWRNLDR